MYSIPVTQLFLVGGTTKDRRFNCSFLLTLLFVFAALNEVVAQKRQCIDEVRLKGGTVLMGKIIAYQPGDTLMMETWSGLTVRIPNDVLEKIVQRCPKRLLPAGQRAEATRYYTFRERGWYHATRGAVLSGVDDLDFSLQHSTGYKLNRWIGVGLGAGIENMNYLQSATIPTYPVFLEIRGYLSAKNVTPFYAIGGGYALAGKASETTANDRWWRAQSEDWKGGWTAQVQAGYRCGNHFFVYGGLRFQRKSLVWEGVNIYGTDRFLHKRLEIGAGILL